MPVERNNIKGFVSATTTVLQSGSTIPLSINYAILTNPCPTTITVNMGMKTFGGNFIIPVMPSGIQIASYDSVEFTDPKVMLPSDKLYLISSNSISYFFSLTDK